MSFYYLLTSTCFQTPYSTRHAPKSVLKGTAADWGGLDPAFMTVSLLSMYLALVSRLSGVDVIYVVHHGQDFAQPCHWTH
jgi:hypothetical protein